MRCFSAEKRMQTGEIWAFSGNISYLPYVPEKTNQYKSAQSKITEGQSLQKLQYLLFLSVARRTTPQKHSRLASLGAVAILLVSSPLSCAFICPRQRHTHSAPNRQKQSTKKTFSEAYSTIFHNISAVEDFFIIECASKTVIYARFAAFLASWMATFSSARESSSCAF